MRAPLSREAFHLCVIGKSFEFIDRLKSLADTEVARGEHVGASQRKDEKHVYGPNADAPHLREVLHDLRARHGAERAVPYRAVRELFRKVFDVRGFLTGESRRTHLFKWHRAYHLRGREFAFRKQFHKTPVYRPCRGTRNLLMDDGADECPERVSPPFQIRQPMLFDNRREALVASQGGNGFVHTQ